MRTPFLVLSMFLVAGTLLSGGRCRPAVPPPSAGGPDPQIRGELIKLLRETSESLPNDCTVARWLLAAHPLADANERDRLRQVLFALAAKTEVSSYKECLVQVRAELVKYLPEEERAAAAEEVVRWVLRSDFAWSNVDETLGEIAGLINADQIARLQKRASTHCCLSSSLAATLARYRRFDTSEAVKQLKECDGCGGQHAVQALLPSLNQTERNQLLERELKLLKEAPELWGLEQIYIVARYVSFLEPERRRELMLAALHRLPQLESEEQSRNIWDDLAPPAHFGLILRGIAPAISDAGLVEAGFKAIPKTWPDDTRAAVMAQFVQSLPPDLRKQVATLYLQTLSGPKNSLSALRSQFAVAESLSVEELHVLIKRYLEAEGDARARAEILGRVYPLLPEPDRAGIQQQMMRDLHAVASAYDRGDAITAILGHQR